MKFALQKEPKRKHQLNHVNPALNAMVKKLGVKIPRHVFMIQSMKFALQKEPKRKHQLNHVNPALNAMVKKPGVKTPLLVFMIQSMKFALQKMMKMLVTSFAFGGKPLCSQINPFSREPSSNSMVPKPSG